MKFCKYFSNGCKHFKTIVKHKHYVFIHACKAGIPIRGLLHDLSKFSFEEFKYGILYFQGNRSPNEGEREDYGYSLAWMHHQGRNKHHFEYWRDYNYETRQVSPVKMPLVYVIEMFCDRVAAGKIYLKDKYTDSSPLQYFEKLRGKREKVIHPLTSDFLEMLLKMLADEGEKKTFKFIRAYRRTHTDYPV